MKKLAIAGLSILLALAMLMSRLPTASADEVYYVWDSATHGTEIWAPYGQVGADAKAYADITGLTKVYAVSGAGLWGHAAAWSDLSSNIEGQGRYVQPTITYEAKGGALNGGISKITLTVIDRSTGDTVGEWSKSLPESKGTPVTDTLTGDSFMAKSDRQYLYWVRVYVQAAISLTAEVLVDYDGTSVWVVNGYVDVQNLYITYQYSLYMSGMCGGHTTPYIMYHTYWFNYGEVAHITAVCTAQGWRLLYWMVDGNRVEKNPYSNSISITMNTDHNVHPIFGSGTGGGGGSGDYYLEGNDTE